MKDEQTNLSTDAPIIELVSKTLIKAHSLRASDIHWEPIPSGLRIRYRIDGLLHEATIFPKKLQGAIINCIKMMTGSMNIAEKRLPQDGRLQMMVKNQKVDFRISCIPTLHGESIVMRLLDKTSFTIGFSNLGLEKDHHDLLKELLHQPEGLILVTGPTGSGKTTTLYACLQELNQPRYKIITVEDPVEYEISGISQVSIQEKIGMTFSAALRSMLRQSVNKIMIGEMRDQETAEIVMNASLTGHLIFSTLHTNDAPSTIARLFNLEIPPFLLATGLQAIISQRLVRRLCNHCKQEASFSDYLSSNIQKNFSSSQKSTLHVPVGCPRCYGTGFRGRIPLFEIVTMDKTIRKTIYEQQTTNQLREELRRRGIRSLREDGQKKIAAGLTTIAEVLAVTTAH